MKASSVLFDCRSSCVTFMHRNKNTSVLIKVLASSSSMLFMLYKLLKTFVHFADKYIHHLWTCFLFMLFCSTSPCYFRLLFISLHSTYILANIVDFLFYWEINWIECILIIFDANLKPSKSLINAKMSLSITLWQHFILFVGNFCIRFSSKDWSL